MPPAHFRCPECQGSIYAPENAYRVKCEHCGFIIRRTSASSAADVGVKAGPPSSRGSDRDRSSLRRRNSDARVEKGSAIPVIAVVAVLSVAGLFLFGVVVVAIPLFLRAEAQPAEQAPVAMVVADLAPVQGAQRAVQQANPPAVVPFQPAQVDPAGGLSLATLEALKRNTVFVKVEAGNQFASGSGFLARIDGDAAFIVTNYHVVKPPQNRFTPFRPRFGARPVVGTVNQPIYTLVFGSGSKNERSYQAEIAAADENNDLAILRVRGIQNPPMPLSMNENIPLVETMPVFILGFPFGEALALDQGNPAVTVGKGSVSSIRLDKQGELAIVQLNGDLNPGNSGGPVVDSQGQLVGIAVATVKGTQIGLAIPVIKLTDLLATAPAQGVIALRPKQPDPAPLLPAPAPKVAPVIIKDQPLDEAELTQHLQSISSGNASRVTSAFKRLSAAKPLDEQRERVVKAAEPLVEKQEFTVGMYALKVLGIWGSKANGPAALRAVNSTSVFLRHEAMRTLGKFKDERAVEPIAKRLATAQDRNVASQALREIGSPGEKAVQPFLKHADIFTRHEACKILAVIGTPASTELLTEAANDSNGLVRTAAQEALASVQARQ